MSRFLVTGASGYIALHVVDQLLKTGHYVRGTVRSLKDEKKIQPIRNLAQSNPKLLELVEAELLDPNSWKSAVENIDYIIHVASPLPIANPADEQEVIKPAVDGTLNVLKAALNTKVKRVVVTSSGLTITGYAYEERTYSEKDWSDVNMNILSF
jgi:nucleoside-diphosphate-sugar epimerase